MKVKKSRLETLRMIISSRELGNQEELLAALRNIRSTVRNIERWPYSDILKSAIPANPKQLSSNNLPSYSYHTRRSIVGKDIANPLPVFPTLLHFFPISLLSKMAEILCTSAFRPMEIGVTTESQRRQDGGNE